MTEKKSSIVRSMPPKGSLIAQKAMSVMDQTDRILIFSGLLLMTWVITWEKAAVYAMTSTVTSLLQANNISGVLTTVLSILQTALNPIYSKVSDIAGRAIAYTFAVVLFIVSFIVMACAQNYNTLIGGQVLYAFGFAGTYILSKIIIGDMIDIVNRSLYLAICNFPTLINLFTGSLAAQKFLDSGKWRWGYGHVTILLFVFSSPIIVSLWRVHRKAKAAGALAQLENERGDMEEPSFVQKTLSLSYEIDLIGSVLLVACLFLILLPLIMANNWGGWRSHNVWGTLIAGGCVLILFLLWEWKGTDKPIIPLAKWESRNPFWGCVLVFLLGLINYVMDFQYFLTYLQVTRGVNSATATYLERGYNAIYCIVPLGLGYVMKRTRRWRPFIWIGVSLTVLSTGLMIPARHSTSSNGFIVIVQILFGTATSFINYPVMVCTQASVPHKDVSIVIALYELSMSISNSIGSTISGAVWNGVLPGLFKKYVPGEYNYSKIVKSIAYAKALPPDQLTGVIHAYDDAMRILSILAVCLGALSFLCAFPMQGFILGEDYVKEEKEEEPGANTMSEHSAIIEGVVSNHGPSEKVLVEEPSAYNVSK